MAVSGQTGVSNVMKAINHESAPELGDMQAGIGALSLRRARHCCASLSLSCRRQGWCAVAGAGVSGKVERDILGLP